MDPSCGVAPDWMIRNMVRKGRIRSDSSIANSQIQPSQLDLTIAEGDYDSVLIERGETKVLPLNELLDLKDYNMHVKADARSSHAAKANITVSVLGEEGAVIPPGYQGRLYIEITPNSSPVIINPSDSLAHMRFYRGSPESCFIKAEKLLENGLRLLPDLPAGYVDDLVRGKLKMTLDLAGGGYKSKRIKRVLETSGGNPQDQYFSRIKGCNELRIYPGSLHLFNTKERLHIVPNEDLPFVAEMEKYNGEGLLVQKAGFIEYGSGPRPQAMEISTYEERDIADGQGICLVSFYRMMGAPMTDYTSRGNRNLDSLTGKLFV
jgi:deoxycytidine triphosphate deaminase